MTARNRVVTAVVVVAMAVGLGLAFAGKGTAARGADGTWVIVNPTPEVARNIMLLNTRTGQAWQTCIDDTHELKWCGPLPRTDSPARQLPAKPRKSPY